MDEKSLRRKTSLRNKRTLAFWGKSALNFIIFIGHKLREAKESGGKGQYKFDVRSLTMRLRFIRTSTRFGSTKASTVYDTPTNVNFLQTHNQITLIASIR